MKSIGSTLTSQLADATTSESSLKNFLFGLSPVDQVGANARAATLSTRSIKTTAKAAGIDLAISMIDLTTLEGMDTASKVRTLCAKGWHPDISDRTIPTVAAICVYGDMAKIAKEALAGSNVKVAAVATAFPSGRASLKVKILDTQEAVQNGADEIDMVIDRGAFLSGQYGKVFDEIQQIKIACGDAHLKVIL